MEDVSGEMVLTNERMLGFSEKGLKRKEVILSFELDIKDIKTINTKKPLVGKEKLVLSVDLGTEKLERMEFEVEDASGWVNAIRSQIK